MRGAAGHSAAAVCNGRGFWRGGGAGSEEAFDPPRPPPACPSLA